MSQYYGWITKVSTKNVGNRDAGTKTGQYFIYYFQKTGSKKFESELIRSKNLYSIGGRNYYVLSIGSGKSTWAPYPFIQEIDNLTLVLTRDIDSNHGDVWVVDIDKVEKKSNGYLKINEQVELTLQTGRNRGGDYYSLSTKQVKTLTGKDKPDYTFGLNGVDESRQIQFVEAIVTDIIEKRCQDEK